VRFRTGLEEAGLKPTFRDERLFRWTEVQLPPLKQGAPTKLRTPFASERAASHPHDAGCDSTVQQARKARP
jgi:hypothetical protein